MDAKSVGHNEPYLGTQGMFVPRYMAGQVKSFEDLAKPEIAAMFDKDGNGKGEYWAGDAGWKSTKMWQVKFKSYGISDLWEPEIVSDATFKAQLKAAYASEKPILFYYWTPEWIHAAYDIVSLTEPPHVEGCVDLKLDQEDWLEASTFNCEHADAMVYVAYSKSLEQRNPAAAKFLSQIKLDPAVVNQWILQIGRDKEDPQDVAETWGRREPGDGERLDQLNVGIGQPGRSTDRSTDRPAFRRAIYRGKSRVHSMCRAPSRAPARDPCPKHADGSVDWSRVHTVYIEFTGD